MSTPPPCIRDDARPVRGPARAHTLLGAAVACAALATSPAAARVGFGDPAAPWRDHRPGEIVQLDGHLRLRAALFANMDLDRGASPSTGEPLWPAGETPLDVTAGSDVRLRAAPSFFLGDTARVFLEIDVLDDVPLGASPRGAPYAGRPAIVAGTAFQDPLTFAQGAFKVRSVVGEVLLPFGVLSAGRAPSHFGLGILTNAGDALDDDGGDRADRLALTAPLFGHHVGVAYSVAASGPTTGAAQAPDAGLLSLAEQSVSLGVVRFRSPWELDAYRDEGYVVLDYGVAVATEWQLRDAPGFYQALDRAAGLDDVATVRRDYVGVVADAWVRFVYEALRVELETFASHLHIDDASPWPGVSLRRPVTGNPVGGALQIEFAPRFDDAAPRARRPLRLLAEVGAASGDPGFGFPLDAPTGFVGSRPGDVYGPQIDGKRDVRMDAARLHPAHKVDLILWRTLLGGVSEAAYGRAHAAYDVVDDVTVEAGAIYSHGLYADATPGGVAPLGVEVDAAAELRFDSFSARVDGGVLFPLGGLGARGGGAPTPAGMILARLGYAM